MTHNYVDFTKQFGGKRSYITPNKISLVDEYNSIYNEWDNNRTATSMDSLKNVYGKLVVAKHDMLGGSTTPNPKLLGEIDSIIATLRSMNLHAPVNKYEMNGGAVEKITSDKLEKLSNGKPSLVLFYADWCGHCKEFRPIWDGLKKFSSDKLNMLETNEENDYKAFDVDGFPTITLIKDGESTEFKGSRDVDTIAQFVNAKVGKNTIKPPI